MSCSSVSVWLLLCEWLWPQSTCILSSSLQTGYVLSNWYFILASPYRVKLGFIVYLVESVPIIYWKPREVDSLSIWCCVSKSKRTSLNLPKSFCTKPFSVVCTGLNPFNFFNGNVDLEFTPNSILGNV